MKYRVKQDVERRRFYPQINILGLWFYLDNEHKIELIKSDESYYTYNIESALTYIERRKRYKETDGVSYEYLPDMKGFRLKKVIKRDINRYYAQKRTMLLWFNFGRKNDIEGNSHIHNNSQSAWDYIKLVDTIIKTPKPPKVLYHYPEKTRKEKIKSLKI